MSPMMLALVVGGAAGMTLILVLLAFSGNSAGKRTAERLARLSSGPKVVEAANVSVRVSTAFSANASLDWAIRTFVPRPQLLRERLAKTGKNISIARYFSASGVIALVTLVVLMVFGLPYWIGLMLGVALGLAIPHFVVGRWVKKRASNFTKLFPDAMDLIVRGLKSGLPVSEGIQQVGREMSAPVGIEFSKVANDVKLGRSLEQALWEASGRLETQEFKFFIISLSVQQETGGNLAETLANLAIILRRRSQMRLKIKAMSSEAKASAMIIGALPFVVILMLMFLSPNYLRPLYSDTRGMIMGGAAAGTMGLGMYIMMKLVNFDI